jgi:hypothetical protein
MKLGSVVTRLSQIPLVPASVSAPSQKQAASPISGALSSSPFSPAFEELINQSLHHYHVPGLAIAIVDGDDTFSRVSSRLCLYSQLCC